MVNTGKSKKNRFNILKYGVSSQATFVAFNVHRVDSTPGSPDWTVRLDSVPARIMHQSGRGGGDCGKHRSGNLKMFSNHPRIAFLCLQKPVYKWES